MFKIETSVEFDAAHFLLETETQCDVLHGHHWKVTAILKSEELNDEGFVLNFTILKKWLKDILGQYDHNLLNYYLEQPTAENLAYTIWRHLHKKLWKYNYKKRWNVEIESVKISETPNNLASFTLNDIDVRKESARRAALKMWDDDEIERMLQSLKKSQKQCPNKEEQQVIEFFRIHNIPLQFVGNGDFILNGKIPDFVDYDKKLIIEYNGRFWHSDDNQWYKVKDDSEERIAMFKTFGYTTYIIWSDIFKEDPDGVLKDIQRLYDTL